MPPIEDAADVLGMFDEADHAVAASYTPQGEAPMTVRVILDRREGLAGAGLGPGMGVGGWEALLPASLVPDRPQRGELLSAAGRDFVIDDAEADGTGAVWRLTLRV